MAQKLLKQEDIREIDWCVFTRYNRKVKSI